MLVFEKKKLKLVYKGVVTYERVRFMKEFMFMKYYNL